MIVCDCTVALIALLLLGLMYGKLNHYVIISREISFIKQKLSEVISQGSSGSVVKDAGVRYGGPWFKLR